MSSNQQKNPYASPTTVYPPAKTMDNGELATLGQRFLGSLIDALIMGPISFVLGFVLGIVLVVIGLAADSIFSILPPP